ncbi:hypothetical protein HJFPF1_05338 [Paramyrothecium foliicola]|nr:hypothetical protein HJFPF1_05338 [Paramyrothecium foliicola]
MLHKRRLSCNSHDDDDGRKDPAPDQHQDRDQPSKRARFSAASPVLAPAVATTAEPAVDVKDHKADAAFPAVDADTSNIANSMPTPLNDVISTLSDELLVRILSFMDEKTLLDISSVSRRFNRITADSQLWRPHFYRRFILPRAHRIPGFRTGATTTSTRLHYSRNASIWADGGFGRRGGLVDPADTSMNFADAVDWKKQYKLRHNWARGRCAVEEVYMSDSESETATDRPRTLVKVTEGLAVTVDSSWGLRAWDLRTRQTIAQVGLDNGQDVYAQPTCLAVDGQRLSRDLLDIVVGFLDGTFGVWTLDIQQKKLLRLYRHSKGFFGELVSVAYLHPYVLTATKVGFVSLYSFETSSPEDVKPTKSPLMESISAAAKGAMKIDVSGNALPAPYLLTSLKSHSTRPPLTLSIRRMAMSVIASIAYTFNTVDGWSIGIQDLDIRPCEGRNPEVATSRVAYTIPTPQRGSPSSSPESSPSRSGLMGRNFDNEDDGPIRLCYSHPYLLATMPDNTLVLHLCTSTSSALSISPGLRLWGHTSGISDAEITPRGKAVSVSSRGDEIRVWELEGRVGGSSVEVRPRQQQQAIDVADNLVHSTSQTNKLSRLDDRRNWVGFDDEMVIVLKEAQNGRESLMVYDFT